MPGVMDDYLAPEEEAYFKSRGKDETVAQEVENIESEEPADETEESPDNAEAPESSQDSESTESTESPDFAEDSESTGTEDDTEEIKKPKRDLEKAFKAEHYKRKQLKAEVEAAKERHKALEEQLQKMREEVARQQQAQQQQLAVPEPEEVPDAETDPLGFYNYKINQLEKATQQHNQYLQQQYEAQRQKAAYDGFINTYRSSTDEYRAKVPDYKEAYEFLYNERVNELMEAGYNQQQADALAKEDELAIVAKAYQDQVNPAERLYKLAMRRGFSGKRSQTKSLDNVEKGLKKSTSLRAGGLPPERDAATGDIDEMGWEEFDKYFEKVKQKQKRR